MSAASNRLGDARIAAGRLAPDDPVRLLVGLLDGGSPAELIDSVIGRLLRELNAAKRTAPGEPPVDAGGRGGEEAGTRYAARTPR
jgi:hypothetical protein